MSGLKGDFNQVGSTNISDVQYLLNWIAAGGNNSNINTELDYKGTKYIITDYKLKLDTNEDGLINIADVQYLLNWIAAGGNASKIGQNLPYKGNQYIIDYIGEQETWNSFTRDIPNPKYRFFLEIYNIPKDSDTKLANIKNDDGVIIKNNGVSAGKISSKSTQNSGYIEKNDAVSNSNLNIDINDPHHEILLSPETFYHKSLSVPMENETTTINEIIVYVFLNGNSYNTPMSNTGNQAKLTLEDLSNNPVINNNDTIIIDHGSNSLYLLKNNTSNKINITTKIVDGVLFS